MNVKTKIEKMNNKKFNQLYNLCYTKTGTVRANILYGSELDRILNGHVVRENSGWSKNKKYFTLSSNTGYEPCKRIMQTLGYKVDFGNDAPRGGAMGYFVKGRNLNIRANEFLRFVAQEKNKRDQK